MSLLIATPMFAGQCLAEHFKSCLNLKDALHENNIDHDWLVTTNESLIPRARNTSAARFLQTDFEYLLFIDGDISFSPDDVARLWNHEEKVVCGAYRMKYPGSKLTVWKDGKQVEIGDDLISVDYAGTGFMMIHRSVFETLIKSYDIEYEEGKVGKCWAFFQDPITDFHLSEDYFFCQRWRELGGEIICDPNIELTHWGLAGYG